MTAGFEALEEKTMGNARKHALLQVVRAVMLANLHENVSTSGGQASGQIKACSWPGGLPG